MLSRSAAEDVDSSLVYKNQAQISRHVLPIPPQLEGSMLPATRHSMATTKDKFGRMLTGQITQLNKMLTTSCSNYLIGSESLTRTTTFKDRFRRPRTSIG